MQQWNGLLRREWVSMKWLLLVSVLFAVTTMAVMPAVVIRAFDMNVLVFEVALVICFLWACASMLAPAVTLLTILEREMKRPDMWLHSNASIFKLIGSKVFFALLIGAGGLLIPTFVLALYYAFGGSSILAFNALLFHGSLFIGAIFVASIAITCMGFFFWVLYRLMEPYIKGFSIPVTIFLFFLVAGITERIMASDVYNKLVKVGPVDLYQLKNPKLEIGNGYFEVIGTNFYTGEIVFNVLFTMAIFIGGAVLFEKKVRL
ncbi:hypothetical protein MKY34_02250 [Sporosarcina sp. FSL K6-1522]|uniref:hypothetical protein n=1 Tax=Sporosarcina sp. FSL K6-1522 TaxID=2921554 RepID=UPI00315ABF14